MPNEQIISDKDLKVIEKMAEKYGLSLQEFGKMIARPKLSYPQLQIMFAEEELALVDSRAAKAKVNRSKYCSLCFKKGLSDEKYSSIDILKVVKDSDKGKRDKRAVISFQGADEYIKMKQLSEELGLPFSGLVRYFVLNVKL